LKNKIERAFETVISPQPKNLAESGESSAQLQVNTFF